jgi:hypothetical protein
MAYEVWCHSCNVTFPIGSKTCLHCGSRTRPERPHGANMRRRSEHAVAPPLLFADEAQPLQDHLLTLSEVEAQEAPAGRSLLRAGMTVVWMILLAAGYAWRACSQQ